MIRNTISLILLVLSLIAWPFTAYLTYCDFSEGNTGMGWFGLLVTLLSLYVSYLFFIEVLRPAWRETREKHAVPAT